MCIRVPPGLCDDAQPFGFWAAHPLALLELRICEMVIIDFDTLPNGYGFLERSGQVEPPILAAHVFLLADGEQVGRRRWPDDSHFPLTPGEWLIPLRYTRRNCGFKVEYFFGLLFDPTLALLVVRAFELCDSHSHRTLNILLPLQPIIHSQNPVDL